MMLFKYFEKGYVSIYIFKYRLYENYKKEINDSCYRITCT